ncbi:hypothetical protein B296_00031156 [Ensete ventricosum]|uniref:Uncharacterized protein n=1 Tax=Ensete ventricosum TaxID=4639 RepID=A0A427A033_ENSVE|nr:hypothetical protein B296_00031156 [Ensete ventricosum]
MERTVRSERWQATPSQEQGSGSEGRQVRSSCLESLKPSLSSSRASPASPNQAHPLQFTKPLPTTRTRKMELSAITISGQGTGGREQDEDGENPADPP